MRERVEHVWPDRIQLLGSTLLTYVPATGDQFIVTLYWRSLREGLGGATELRWRVDPNFACDGTCSAEWRAPLVPDTQVALRQGDVVAANYAQRLPLDLPVGSYRLQIAFGDESFALANLDVVHKARSFDVPAGAERIGSLGGFDVFLVGSLPTQMRPGESIHLRFALRATREVDVNYNVFAHLIDLNDRVVAQVDAWPQGGAWPTINWVPGQVVEDVYLLTLPPDAAPGEYRIALGMYDPLGGSRLPALDSADRVALDGRLILAAPIPVVAP